MSPAEPLMREGETVGADAGAKAAGTPRLHALRGGAELCPSGAKGRLGAVQRRERAARLHRRVRIGVQLVFFLLAPGLFAAAFNGVKYLFASMGALEPFEATSFVVVLVALLAYTVAFGRFFCGYACAFGALGDWVHGAGRALLDRTPLRGMAIPERVMRPLSLVKYGLAAAICVACVAGAWSAVSGYSPWVAFAGLTSLSAEGIAAGAFVLLALGVAGMVLSERFFCRVLCPMGAIFALMPVLGASSFTRTRGHCAGRCGKCRDACPVGNWPDADTLSHGECIACGRCADACPLGNVNLVALPRQGGESPDAGRPVRKTREEWRLLPGTSPAVVVVKAAVLLALCWAVGVTRYLPSVSEVIAAVPWPF